MRDNGTEGSEADMSGGGGGLAGYGPTVQRGLLRRKIDDAVARLSRLLTARR